ncbi:hypothetical protein E2320_017396, partial [Naja naja]
MTPQSGARAWLGKLADGLQGIESTPQAPNAQTGKLEDRFSITLVSTYGLSGLFAFSPHLPIPIQRTRAWLGKLADGLQGIESTPQAPNAQTGKLEDRFSITL